MEFLRGCAERLDAGESAETVMRDLRTRYGTLRCVNVKACLVRGMCRPTPEYLDACEELMTRHEVLRECFDVQTGVCSDAAHRPLLRELPPRLSENVRRFTITREEVRQCKREAAYRAISKNRCVERVDARRLLTHARHVVHVGTGTVPELTFALMLLTGRRECEILNGQSAFTPHTEYSVSFLGQAKKRGAEAEYVIPTLAPVDQIVATLASLRDRQQHTVLTNHATSRRYQSYLSRSLTALDPWSECKRVHSLRGLYACMAYRLFDWGERSEAFVTMCLLGHSSLNESLVYTPFQLGDALAAEPTLGIGQVTEMELPMWT